MAFYRASIGGGGGGGSDVKLGQVPDATWANNGTNLSPNSTATVSVSQKPRYIMIIMLSNNAREGLIGFYDTQRNEAYRYGYWSSTRQDGVWTNYTSYITSVTDSAVTVKQAYSTGQNIRTWVNCYYDNGGGVPDTATGVFVTNTTSASGYKVTLGFKPKYVYVIRDANGTNSAIYDERISTTKFLRGTSGATTWVNMPASQYLGFVSIDNDGFTFYTNSSYSSVNLYYVAMR